MVNDVIVCKVPGLPLFAASDGTIYNKHGMAYKAQESKTGYLRIITKIKGKSVSLLIHRLVALAFIDNPYNLPCVNHKDENKCNNCVDNLEWCTHKYNANYGKRREKIGISLQNRADRSKPVYRVFGGESILYPSAKQAERELGINNSNIIGCCLGKRRTAGGYVWRYA